MTIKQMEYILELSRTRNFNRAAENLFITQPALTYQIQRAEEEIGFTLFVRSGRGATLTIAGQEFSAAIERMLEEYREAVSAGQKLDPLYSAAITIVMPERFAIPNLSETIEAFEAEFPRIPITPKYYETDKQVEIPEADIAFVIKGNRMARRKGWKEQFTVLGYSGLKGVPRVSDVKDAQEETIWIPFNANAIKTSVQMKSDEEREEVLNFLSRFQQVSQK